MRRLFQKLTEEFELPTEKKFKALSYGMKMKFARGHRPFPRCRPFDSGRTAIAGLDPDLPHRARLTDWPAAHGGRTEIGPVFNSYHHRPGKDRRLTSPFIRDGEIVFTAAKDELLENWAVSQKPGEIASTSAAVRRA